MYNNNADAGYDDWKTTEPDNEPYGEDTFLCCECDTRYHTDELHELVELDVLEDICDRCGPSNFSELSKLGNIHTENIFKLLSEIQENGVYNIASLMHDINPQFIDIVTDFLDELEFKEYLR